MHTNPEVLALLALGEDSATPQERTHVETCPACRRDLAELAHLTGVGRAVDDARPLESPSPQVWERIQAELGFHTTRSDVVADPVPAPESPVRPRNSSAPGYGANLDQETETGRALIGASTATDAGLDATGATTGSAPSSDVPSSRRRRALALALAAALALIAGMGLGLGWNSLSEPSATVIGEAQLQPGDPAWNGASGEATLERDANGQRVLVVRVSTPRPVPGIRTVWIMDSTFKKMQTVGQLAGTEGRFTIEPSTNLADFPVVDISEEPTNDTNPVHSGVTILRGTLNI